MGNLTENDFQRVADLLGIEVAVVKAVQAVETGGHGGFVAPGRPMILFEGHIFWRELKKRGLDPERYVAGNENILYPKWEKGHYYGGKSMNVWKRPGKYIRKLLTLPLHGECSK